MSTALSISRVPIQTLAAFMEAVATHPTGDAASIAKFAGFSSKTGSRALPSLETLGVMERDASGIYRVKTDGVTRGMSPDEATLMLRRALPGLPAVRDACRGLALGEHWTWRLARRRFCSKSMMATPSG